MQTPSNNLFIPKINRETSSEQPSEQNYVVSKNNHVTPLVQKIARYSVVVLFGLLPIFFIPNLWGSLGLDKSVLTLAVSAVVLIMVSLLMLRQAKSLTVLPFSLGIFWLAVLTALVSGLLSPNVLESLRGSILEVQTVAFLGILGLAMSIPLVIQGSKKMSIKALAFFGFAATLLLIYNLVRLLFGAEFLSMVSFADSTVSPIGGFNDLAIFAGLVIMMGIVTLVQLPLKTLLQSIVSALIFGSLIILSIINFFNIWLVVGFFALLVLIYLLSRGTIFKNTDDESPARSSRLLITTVSIVCVVSATFILAGSYVGEKVNNLTEVRYFEVQPTLTVTMSIAKSVYADDVLFGIGPNRFADAWRQYKDPSVNQTIFWNTNFDAGSGFVPTLFVNIGLLGGILIVLFHLYFLYLGYKMLLRSKSNDSYWYYLGSVSFVAAVFVWGMSYVYVPGAGILLLGALFTGLTYVAAGSLLPSMIRVIPLTVNRQRGFFIMAATILIITTSIGALFSVGKQYVAQANFVEAQLDNKSIAELETIASNSYQMYADDRFISILSQIQLANLSALLNVQNPTEQQQQQFLSTAEKALLFSEKAVEINPTSPDNRVIRAAIYGNLSLAGVEGARERVDEGLAKAQELDPFNPSYHLISAQLAARIGDLEKAKTEIAAALSLKPNFTQALYLSAQIDIREENTESAIATTRSIITLEPNNPTLYFQLGVLLSANNQLAEAIEAYKVAIVINPVYANARYLLALAYIQTEQPELALEQLKIVQQTNGENNELNTLIQQVESGEPVSVPSLGYDVPVEESSPSTGFDDAVTTDGEIDTDLVSPVNVISDNGDEAEDVIEDTEVAEEVAPEEISTTEEEESGAEAEVTE